MIGWLIGEASPSADDGGAVDIGFLQDMRIHHEQAVQMALIYRDLEDTDPGCARSPAASSSARASTSAR